MEIRYCVSYSPALPKSQGQLVVGLDLLRQFPDCVESDAELIVAGTVLGVLRSHLLVSERFELLESLFEIHGRDCNMSALRLEVVEVSAIC